MNFMYDMPQESGNRTETRWIRVTNERGIGLKAVLGHNQNSSSRPPISSSKDERPGSPLDHWTKVDKALEDVFEPVGFDFALSRYSAKDLEQAQHPHELKCSDGIVFRIDHDHHGLGTAACGPDVLDQYQLKTRDFSFSVYLEPIGP